MQSGFEPTSFNFHRQDEKVWQHDWVRFLKWLRMSCSYSTFHFERSKQQLKRRRRDKQEERRVGHENKWPHRKTETEANSAESSIGDKHKEEKVRQERTLNTVCHQEYMCNSQFKTQSVPLVWYT